MTARPTVVAALAAIASSALLAFVLQLIMLGATGFSGGPTSGNSDPDLALDAAANTRPASVGPVTGLRFEPARGPAVAQAPNLSLNAANTLALILHAEDVTSNLRLTLGWLTTLDLRRPSTATVTLAANADPQQTVLLLAGHPRWKETVTRVALALENAGAANATVAPGAFLARAELLPANPIGGARLLAAAWFKSDGNIVTPNESASRLLPLSLWLALICASSLLAVALVYRKNPEQRAAALRSCAGALMLAIALLTVLANRWPGWTVPLGGGMAAALALLLLDRTITLPLTQLQRGSMALVAAGLAILLAPLVAAVAVVPAILLLLGQLAKPSQREPAVRIGALLAIVPALLLAAVAQGMIPAPALLRPLIDPSRTLTTVATSAGGLPGLALGMLAMHRLWPAPAVSQRWSNAAVAAAVWALMSAVAVLAIPKIAVLAGGSSTYIAVFFPALACLALAVLPKLQAVARSIDETVVVEAKSEQDLSTQALTLLESHADRVQTALARREIGAAHLALANMQRIAPAAHATALASLRVALSDGDLGAAASAAEQVTQSGALSVADSDALLQLAHRSNQQRRVIELAAGASRTEDNLRALAIAHVLTDGPALALEALSSWPNEQTFAREMAELHLLNDDIPATQRALVNSGITMAEPTGQAYVARIGLRVQGAPAHANTINSIATWHPKLAAAQAAQGELLQRLGNPVGARARFLLAIKLDTGMWPLQYQLRRIDGMAQAAQAAPPPASTVAPDKLNPTGS